MSIEIRPIADGDGDRLIRFHDAGFPMTSRFVDGSDEIRMDIRLTPAPRQVDRSDR